MDQNEQTDRLFPEFSPVTDAEWEEKVIADLKGADYAKKLIWKTPEGFDVKPYYRSGDLKGLEYLDVAPGAAPFVRGLKKQGNPWAIRQDIAESDVGTANRKALDAISRGADAIGFDATEVTTHKQIHQLLEGIDLTRTGIACTDSNAKYGAAQETARQRLECVCFSTALDTNPETVKKIPARRAAMNRPHSKRWRDLGGAAQHRHAPANL